MKSQEDAVTTPLSPLEEEAKQEATMTVSRMALGYGYICVGTGFVFTAIRLVPFLHDPIAGDPIGDFFHTVTGWPRLVNEICIMLVLWLTLLWSLSLLRPLDLYGNRISLFSVVCTFMLGTVIGAWLGMVVGGENGYLPYLPFAGVGMIVLVCWVILAMRSIEVYQKRRQRAQGYTVVGSHTKGYVAMTDTTLVGH